MEQPHLSLTEVSEQRGDSVFVADLVLLLGATLHHPQHAESARCLTERGGRSGWRRSISIEQMQVLWRDA